MSSTDKLPTTQRAYTLRIADYVVEPATPNTATNWRSRIWHTHLATNRGTAAFGEWLLTLRGGLDHRLADLPPLTQDQVAAELELLTKAAKNDNRPVPAAEDARMSAEEKRHGQIGERRVLLAMSWLVVEVGYQGSFALVPDQVVPAFRGILKGRGMGEREMDDWVRDCASSLSAAIKPGATWVNRSAAFDAGLLQLGPTLNRDEIWDLMLRFFGSQDAYLEPVALEEDEGAPATEEKAKDLVQKAGQWLSSRFGTGRGADFTKMGKVYSEMATWAATVQAPLSSSDFFGQLAAALKVSATGNDTADAILALISGPGYKSATRNLILKFGGQAMIFEADVAKLVEAAGQDEQIAGGKVGGKGHREWSDRLLAGVEQICGFTYLGQEPSAGEETDDNEPAKRGAARHGEFSVMLDHAARRVSLVHSWAKRAEAERRQFTAAAAKLTPLRQTHPSGVAFLDAFCAQRSISTFAEDAYRIRPRAVQGWKQVVAVWRQPDCHTVEERIASARAAQDSDEIDKFGDIQLFEAMAEEDARCVWGAGAELLLDYAAATDADHKRERFKVPAYCHPHPLRHPVFCDFGNSRWEVKFACHAARMRRKDKSGRPEGPTCLERAKAKLDARKGEMARAETKLAQFRNETERKERLVRLEEARQSLSEAQAELGWLESPRALSLTLLNGTTPEPTLLRWQSKRLSADLAFGQSGGGAETPPIEVSRATRHARAAARTLPDAPVKILQLFDDESWNCRLQAPRQQLDRLAAYLDKHNLSMDAEATWDEAARRQRDHIEWLGTFSAKLTLQGPWTDYCNSLKDQTPFRRKNQSIKADAARQVSMKVWPHGELNNSRGGRAKLTLSRLPGLRVLSVDLGHRYGAACAVWETMTGGQLAALCQETGTPPPGGDTVCHTVRKETNGKRRTIILRRLGPDTLDGQPHPAPWARLDRQFLVKLQGEESATRMASPAELAFVKDLELACGMAPERPPTPGGATAKPATVRGPSLDLDEVMSRAVDTLRHELKRHALRARLARDINALRPPGMGGKGRSTDLAGEDLKNHITGLFVAWFGLASSAKAPDSEAQRLWVRHIEPHLAATLAAGTGQRENAQARKQRQKANEDLLAPAVAYWQSGDRSVLASDWHQVWQAGDVRLQPLLGRLRDWLRPGAGRMRTREERISMRRTGGLSLSRLANLRSFYQLQKAFAGRERWMQGAGGWGHTPVAEQFGQRTLDALERLRDQRVKQLASRIAGAALGLAPAAPTPAEITAGGHTSTGLARQRLGKLTCRFEPCHAVVVESLGNYRPDQLQTRRENRQLLQWSSSKVQKQLQEACELHGLHLREIPPAYTSRQDSRSGAPGLRCRDVATADFLEPNGYWERDVLRLKEKGEQGKALKPREQLLVSTHDHLKAVQGDRAATRPVRLIQEGGELFVSADDRSPGARGIQADLNAAANIGLKALLDPDWEGAWWFVPCGRGTHIPKPDSVKGARPFDGLAPLHAAGAGPSSAPKKQREFVNLWRDVSSAPVGWGNWQETTGYWAGVEARVAALVGVHNGLPHEDDIPM